MKPILRHLITVVLAFLICSCASTSLNNTWKSPEYRGGSVCKIAVLAADERPMARQILEGHTAGRLKDRGQPAFAVNELLTLDDIKTNPNRATERLRAEGADAVLILRSGGSQLLNSGTGSKGRSSQPQFDSWYSFYLSMSPYDITGLHSTLKQGVFINSALYDLKTEKPLWSCVTETKVAENSDKLELLKPLVLTIVQAMATDGMIH